MDETIVNDGERFIPTDAGSYEVKVNLDRYLYAMKHIAGESVIELGCGAGLGTYLYSLVASRVTAYDYSQAALTLTARYPYDSNKVRLVKQDLITNAPIEPADVCVAIEFLEHILEPETILAALDVKKLVFALPLDSMRISTWHRYPIRPKEEGIEDVKRLIGRNFVIEEMDIQNRIWVVGVARRRKSWL